MDTERYARLKQKTDRWNKLTDAEKDRRIHVWTHNSLMGHVAMARAGMRNICGAPSATDEAKEIAGRIWDLLCDLDTELRKERVDGSR